MIELILLIFFHFFEGNKSIPLLKRIIDHFSPFEKCHCTVYNIHNFFFMLGFLSLVLLVYSLIFLPIDFVHLLSYCHIHRDYDISISISKASHPFKFSKIICIFQCFTKHFYVGNVLFFLR